MRLRILVVIPAVLAIALTGQTTPEQPSADGVVRAYVAARGGLAAMMATRTLVLRGSYSESSFHDSHAYMARMRPNMRVVGDVREHADIAEGFDNSAWEYYADPGIVLRTTGPAEAASRRGAEFDDPLVNYRAKGHVVDLLGIEQIAGRPAYRLHVTLNDGAELEKFIGVEDGLLVAERRTVPQHAFGRSVTSETRIGDYVSVQGVRYPTTFREVEISSGKVLNELHWQSIEANVDLDASMFSPPMIHRTPLQQLLQTLYDSRSDTAIVMRTYRSFKSSSATARIDTEAGIEMVGYQCVKMAALGTATALLRANAGDYPHSAVAQFGLGRALQAAADPDGARNAYEAALRLDPRYVRARDALAALGE